MKKFLVAAVALVFCGSAFAIDNEPESGFSTQVFLGMTTSKINTLNYLNVEKGLTPYDGKVGGTAGIKLEYMLPNAHGTYINAGVDWIMKGAKATEEMVFTPLNQKCKGTYKFNEHYIEIPVHVGFRYNITRDWGVYGELGPYFAIGVGGKYSTTLDANGSWTKEYEYDYALFKNDDSRRNFQRWDAGMGFRIGGEYMQHYSLNLGCDWGITDMWRNSYKDAIADGGVDLDKIHNFSFQLTFGYRF